MWRGRENPRHTLGTGLWFVGVCVYRKSLSQGSQVGGLSVQGLLSQGKKLEPYPECSGEGKKGV